MNELEQKWVKKALINWIENNERTTIISQSIAIFPKSKPNNYEKYKKHKDKHIIRNPLVIIAGASKYNSSNKFYEDGKNDLPGAEIDMKKFINLLAYEYNYDTKSTFEVLNKDKTNRLEMSRLINFLNEQYKFLNQNKQKYDSLICILVGHGTGDKNGNDTFMTSDMNLVDISYIKELFLSKQNNDFQNSFTHKPKIFIKLACRSSDDQTKNLKRYISNSVRNNKSSNKKPTINSEGEVFTIWANTSSQKILDNTKGEGGFLAKNLSETLLDNKKRFKDLTSIMMLLTNQSKRRIQRL